MGEEEELGETLAMAGALTLEDAPSSAQFNSPSDLCPDLHSLSDLAARGQWRAVLAEIDQSRSLPDLVSAPPHHRFVLVAVAVLALFKLRRYADAARELAQCNLLTPSPPLVNPSLRSSSRPSSDRVESLPEVYPDRSSPPLDNPSRRSSAIPHSEIYSDRSSPPLDNPSMQRPDRFESYPEIYPGRSGSMIPFALRFFHAEIPFRLDGNRSETLDRLYALLSFVRVNISGKSDWLWRRREAFVIGSICRHHFSNREFDLCLILIGELLSKNPDDPTILSRLGYVQLQIGDVDGAIKIFDRVEAICGDRDRNLIGRNRALRMIAGKDYQGAVREYDACIERDPSDIVAINNKALCLLYSRDLSDSIKVLEGALERVPTVAVNETAVVNLCSMYELAFSNHVEIKKNLHSWISRVAPDDFDSSCTRI